MICIHTYIYANTYIHIYIHTYIYVVFGCPVHVSQRFNLYMICIHACIYIHIYIHTNMHAYICIYVYSCIHTYIQVVFGCPVQQGYGMTENFGAAVVQPLGRHLQHAANRRNTLQHTAAHCSTLQHTAHMRHSTRNTLQHTANTLPTHTQNTATHCQHPIIPCTQMLTGYSRRVTTIRSTLQYTATHPLHTYTHRLLLEVRKIRSTLQHTATHCHTLPRTATPPAHIHSPATPMGDNNLQTLYIAVCCSVLHCVAVHCGVHEEPEYDIAGSCSM